MPEQRKRVRWHPESKKVSKVDAERQINIMPEQRKSVRWHPQNKEVSKVDAEK